MGRIIGTYGIIGGFIVAIGMWLSITFVPIGGAMGMAAGYLAMLVALSVIFVGVKKYRDTEKAGVIRFWPAFGVGLGITCVAGLIYVAWWELYMYLTNYTFMDEFVRQTLESMRAAGKAEAEIAKFQSEMDVVKLQYADPLFRMPFTFIEIAPVGLLVSLVSAALLRKSSFVPAKSSGV